MSRCRCPLRSLLLPLVSLALAPAPALALSFQNGVDGYLGADNKSYSFDGTIEHDVIRVDRPLTGEAGSYAWVVFADLVGPGAIPPGATIAQAVLEGWVTNPFGSATVTLLLDDIANRPVSPNRIDDAGVAGSFYDDTLDVSATHPGCADSSLCDPPVLVTWDVTDLVQALADGAPNFGFLILPDTTNGGNLAGTDDATVSLRPRLVVTLAPEPGTIALTGLALAALVAFRSRTR